MKVWIRSGLLIVGMAWVWSRQQEEIRRLRTENERLRETANKYRSGAEAYEKHRATVAKVARNYYARTGRRPHDDNPPTR